MCYLNRTEISKSLLSLCPQIWYLSPDSVVSKKNQQWLTSSRKQCIEGSLDWLTALPSCKRMLVGTSHQEGCPQSCCRPAWCRYLHSSALSTGYCWLPWQHGECQTWEGPAALCLQHPGAITATVLPITQCHAHFKDQEVNLIGAACITWLTASLNFHRVNKLCLPCQELGWEGRE